MIRLINRIVSLVLIFAIGPLFNVWADSLPSTLTLAELQKIALRENRDLKAARYLIGEAEGRLKQAGLWPNPELELSGSDDGAFNNEGEYAFSTGFRQKFPISGRLSKARAVGRVDVAMALAEVRNQERILLGEVLGAGRRLIVLKEKLKAIADIEGAVQIQLDISHKRFKLAEVSETDVNLSRLELEKLRLTRNTYINERNVLIASLNAFLGHDPSDSLDITGEAFPTVLQATKEILPSALSKRPDRQLAALSVDRAKAELQLARAERWEDWTIGFDISRDRSSDFPTELQSDSFVGLSISIPLPLLNRNQGKLVEIEANKKRQIEALSALDLRISTEIETALSRVRILSESLRQYQQDSIPLSKENLSLLQKGYADGLTPITNVIQAQQQLTELRLASLDLMDEVARAQTDLVTAAASSEFLEEDFQSEHKQ